jgi:transcriptional regulator with XRE-family HTH domain
MSQQELATRAGIAQSMVAAYENGRRQPTVATLARLLEAAGAQLRLTAERSGTNGNGVTPQRSGRGRPGALTICDVARKVKSCLRAGDPTGAWRWLLQFADDFRSCPAEARRRLVAEAPEPVGDRAHDAAIAGLVEHLCAERGTGAPAWTSAPERFAEPWWFPAALPALRARALRDSPISFKRHGVFVTAEAFDRV